MTHPLHIPFSYHFVLTMQPPPPLPYPFFSLPFQLPYYRNLRIYFEKGGVGGGKEIVEEGERVDVEGVGWGVGGIGG